MISVTLFAALALLTIRPVGRFVIGLLQDPMLEIVARWQAWREPDRLPIGAIRLADDLAVAVGAVLVFGAYGWGFVAVIVNQI